MCILGGILVDQAIVQPLTEYICLSGDPDVESRLRYVARVFEALAVGMDSLRRFYKDLEPTTSPIPAHIFPYSASYVHSVDGLVQFHYICRLQPDTKWRDQGR
jgi:hypothetical protein